MLLLVLASVPPLLAAMLAGFVAGALQTLTQVQESSLSAVPRLASALGALALTAPWIGGQFVRFAARLLQTLAMVAL